MRKNSKVHFWIETEIKQALEKRAYGDGLTISQYCRNRLNDADKISSIEGMVKKILFLLQNRKVYKGVHILNNKHETN